MNMAVYFIISKHAPEQCLRALDEEFEKGLLDKFVTAARAETTPAMRSWKREA